MDDVKAAFRADSWPELCLFLDGSPTSFTGKLLTLCESADPGNLARLRQGFPRHVAAWEEWRAHAPLSWGELEKLTEARMGHPWDGAHTLCGMKVPGVRDD